MEKLIFDDSEIVRVALKQEISRSPESRYDHRLHELLFLCHGMSTYEAGNLLGHSPRTIQYWFHRFQEEGLIGLLDAEGRGRHSSLNPRQQKQLKADLRKRPSALGYPQGQWDGVLLSHHLDWKFGSNVGVRQSQRLFYQFGFGDASRGGIIAGANPEDQQAYKNTSSAHEKR